MASLPDSLTERRLALLVEHLPIAVLMETAERTVAQTNQAFTELFGVPLGPDDLIGMDCTTAAERLAHLWPDPAAFMARVDAVLAAGLPVTGERIELTDGRVLQRDFLLTPVDGTRGEATWIYRDITAIDAARRTAEADALARSELLATISHDVRTPVVGIVGLVDLLLQEPLDPRTRELVEGVKASAAAMTTMVDNVLDLARTQAGRLELSLEETDVCDLIEAVAGMVGIQAQAKSLPLVAAATPAVPEMVLTDPGRLRQIVLNLVSNAVKFTSTGAVTLLADADGRDLVLTVTDTGPGMAEQTVSGIFGTFSQGAAEVNRQHGGAGLGLAIALRLTQALGGTIRVDSELGRGTTFTVRLPDSLRGPAPTAPAPGPRARVLGHPVAVVAAQAALQRAGVRLDATGTDPVTLEVVVAGSVEEAQRVLPTPGRRLLILVPEALASCPPLAGVGVALPWTRSRLSAALDGRTATPAHVRVAQLANGTQVLLAEDEPSNRRILAEMLRRMGAEVREVGDGLAAIEALGSDRFDVVLLDLTMPVLDGRRAAAEMQRRIPPDRRPPILALTADESADPEILARDGFAGRVRKPATSADLGRAIAQVLEREPGVLAPAAVDPGVLASLADDLGDAGIVGETMDIYLAELPGRLESMTGALHGQRFDVLRDTAHGLKSASRMLGAARLADLCRDVEAASTVESRGPVAHGGDLSPLVDALHAEALRVAQAMSDLREAGYPELATSARSGT